MKVLYLVLGLAIAPMCNAETLTQCQGYGSEAAEGIFVEYEYFQFEPCDGPCPKMVTLPEFEIKRQLEADVYETFTGGTFQISALERMPQIQRSKRVEQELNSRGKAVGTQNVRYLREELYDAVMTHPKIPGNGIQVQCKKTITSKKFL